MDSSKGKRSMFGSMKKLVSRKTNTDTDKKSNSNMGNSAVPAKDANPFRSSAPATRRPATDAPPSYMEVLHQPTGPSRGREVSPAPSNMSTLSIGNMPLQTEEDPYAFLSTFDTIFLIDDSLSMGFDGGTCWKEAADVLKAIAPICAAHDVDGIDVYFLNNRKPKSPAGGFLNITSAVAVQNLFETVSPKGATPTGTRLHEIIWPYLATFDKELKAKGGDAEATKIKPVNVIVITDGSPTDDPESVLLSFAKKLDAMEAPPYQLGVQFFQVGNDRRAREALMELDDNLGKEAGRGVRDIIDTTTWDGKGRRPELTPDGMLKAVLGAVVKRLDRKRISIDGGNRNHLRP